MRVPDEPGRGHAPARLGLTAPRGLRARQRGPERGQATVELALAIPVIVVLALVVVQVGWLVHDRVLVVHAAREAARAAAVIDGTAGTVPTGVRDRGLDPGRLEVWVEGPDAAGMVTAVARYEAATDVALVGPLVPDVTMESRVTMLHEPSLQP